MSAARPRRWHLTIQCPGCGQYQEPLAIIDEITIEPLLANEVERNEFTVLLLQGSRTFRCQNYNCQMHGRDMNTTAVRHQQKISPVLREMM